MLQGVCATKYSQLSIGLRCCENKKYLVMSFSVGMMQAEPGGLVVVPAQKHKAASLDSPGGLDFHAVLTFTLFSLP